NHLNFKTINKLSRSDLVVGMPKITFLKDKVCDACKSGKQTKASFKIKGNIQSNRLLDLFHMDLFGHIPISSIGGSKYCLVVIDDYSKFTWVVPLKTKDQTQNKLIGLIRQVQTETDLQLARIRNDKG
ncbi:hypothetical protein RF094_08845, partial [Serratia marcescens]